MSEPNSRNLEQQVKSVLDRSVEEIGDDIQYQLQLARARALEKGNDSIPWYRRRVAWASVAGLVSACVLTLALFGELSVYNPAGRELASAIETSLFEDDTSMELYEEYEFYVWLSDQGSSS